MIFNLAEHLGLTKEAMGAVHWKNRENPLETWSLETIERAQDGDPDYSSWKEWVDAIPSLKDMVTLAQSERQKYVEKVSSYYEITPESANKVLRVFIAYEPMAGPYILFTGPYVSKGVWHGPEHIREEANGKFIASTLAVAPNSIRACKKAIQYRIKKLQKAFEKTSQGEDTGIQFEDGDFTLVEREPSFVDENGRKLKGRVINKIEGVGQLEPLIPNPNNSPEIALQNQEIRQRNLEVNPQAAQNEFFDEGHITANKEWALNKDGYEKIMNSLMKPFYDKAVSERAEELVNNAGVSMEDATRMVVADYSKDAASLAEFYEKVRKSRMAAIKDANDPLHMEVMSKVGLGYPAPPSFNSVHTQTFGQVVPREVRPPTDAKDLYVFRKKIVDLIRSGISDVDEIEEVINAGLPDKHKTPISKISSEINKIADMRSTIILEGGQGTYDGIIERIDQNLKELTSYGYRDMQMAVDMLEAYLTTRGGSPNLKIEDKNDFQLKTIAEIAEIDTEDDGEELTDEELDLQLEEGEVNEEVMPQQEKVEVPVEGDPQPAQPRQIAPNPILPAEEEDEDEELADLLDLIGNTLKGLIKVARELDSEGKGEAAEEVHKVIRKYQKRIR